MFLSISHSFAGSIIGKSVIFKTAGLLEWVESFFFTAAVAELFLFCKLEGRRSVSSFYVCRKPLILLNAD